MTKSDRSVSISRLKNRFRANVLIQTVITFELNTEIVQGCLHMCADKGLHFFAM